MAYDEEIAAIFDAFPGMALISRDPLCQRIVGNRATYTLLRLPYGANISKSAVEGERPTSFRVMKDGQEISAHELPMQKAAGTGRPVRNSEITLLFPDGTSRQMLGSAAPLLDEAGAVKGAVGMFVDITKRKEAELALLQTQAELAHATRVLGMGELVASIAHEINQPLTGVVTNGNFALRELASDTPRLEQVRDAVQWMVEDGNRASAIISRVRALLKKHTPERSQVNINDLIQEVMALTHNETVQKQVRVRLELELDPTNVHGDVIQLEQVLINLILNAIEAMSRVEARPRILNIRSVNHSEGALVQIRDSGIGLDPKEVDRVFEPFFTTKPDGVGMGLAISRSIIESHGGRLWAEREPEGTVFQFILPVSESDAA